MLRYELNIKSHTDSPDYSTIIFAENLEQAMQRAYDDLRGEYSWDFIRDNLEEIHETN